MKAIEVNDLRISYKTIAPFSIKHNLLKMKLAQTKIFEAVKGVSFSVDEGDVIGLIGSNGSGKTTLLRCLAGIFSANEGTIDLFDNTVSLLSIGVGFQNELTGYDNIFLSGLLMGYTKQHIKSKIDDIIAFSELGDFIYMPVKTYSSGMYSKLAFSITAILEADILLIDEVFSVGDARFKKKSAEKMKEIITNQTKTIIIVSHSMDTIRKFCNKAIWLNNGCIAMQGETNQVVGAYEAASGVTGAAKK